MAEKKVEQEMAPEGVTTRDDAKDLGVPMLAGDAATEPVGPEDALGAGPKRGDYTARQPENTVHYAAVANPSHDPSDPDSPRSVLVEQNPLVEQRGDDKGVKGGTRPLTEAL